MWPQPLKSSQSSGRHRLWSWGWSKGVIQNHSGSLTYWCGGKSTEPLMLPLALPSDEQGTAGFHKREWLTPGGHQGRPEGGLEI